MRAVPDGGMKRSGDVDAAARAHHVGQCAALGDVGEILFALLGIGVEHVLPRAHFGDGHVLGVKGIANGANAVAVGVDGVGTVGGAVAQTSMLARQFARVGGLEKDGPAEADGPCGGGEFAREQRRGGEQLAACHVAIPLRVVLCVQHTGTRGA